MVKINLGIRSAIVAELIIFILPTMIRFLLCQAFLGIHIRTT
jgi:hypothetical protein